MIRVRKLIWDTWNVQHISRHHVTPEEVEAVCHEKPIVLRGQQKNRLVLIGPTEENVILTLILESQGHSTYYVITAYPSDSSDIKLYSKLRGGEDNNEK